MGFLSNVGGGIAEGIINIGGQLLANQESRRSTARQMAFQERMSGTAYQRMVADLKAAGLNPMLAYMEGGASSPSGSSYSAGAPEANFVGSALASKRLSADVAAIDQSMEESRSRQAKTDAEAELLRLQKPGMIVRSKLDLMKDTYLMDRLQKAIDAVSGFTFSGKDSERKKVPKSIPGESEPYWEIK